MSINNLLPDPREVSQNDISTFYDLRQINMQYKFGRITATEAMAQVDKRIKNTMKIMTACISHFTMR